MCTQMLRFGALRKCGVSVCVKCIKYNHRYFSNTAETENNIIPKLTSKKLSHNNSTINSFVLGKNKLNDLNERTKHIDSRSYVVKEDRICDEKVKYFIHCNDINSAFSTMMHYYNVNRYPSRKTLLILATLLASEGNIEALQKIQIACKMAYPQEYKYEMEYNHYIAECLWKVGKYKESIELFYELLLNHPLRTKKLSDMINFLARDLVQNKHEKEIHLLVMYLMNCAKHDIYKPLSNVWQQLFLSDVKTQQILADKILKESGPYSKLKKFILTKTDSIIKTSVEDNRTDLLQRLIEVMLFYQDKVIFPRLFNIILDQQCNKDDINGAMATFNYMSSENIPVKNTVCHKLLFLFGYHGKEAPDALKTVKYNVESCIKKIKYKF